MADQDAAWIASIASGDRGAFEALFQAYHRRVFGYVFRITGDVTAAEEITSDVLFEVWKGARRFAGRSRVSTWIFGIAHHKVVDALRRSSAEPPRGDMPAAVVDHAPGPDAGIDREAQRVRLRQALDALTPEHREVIELAFYQDLSVDEIAGIVRCPPGTVKTRMFYARQKLREVLEP